LLGDLTQKQRSGVTLSKTEEDEEGFG
jgi:hypothetical protein